ncbi:MAG TPA: amino acid--tRNA ligase-related protein, partial [Blastocatellia bacterium]
MARVNIKDAGKHVGEEVQVAGWLYNLRSSGKLLFPLIRDGSGIIQGVIFKKNVPEHVWNAFEGLTQESSLIVTGTFRADQRAPGGYEMDITGVEVVQVAEPYPITPKDHGVEFLMNHRHLWLRSRNQHAILTVRAEVIRAVRDYLDSNGFLLMDTPIFTPSACEGTTNLFEVDYFEDSKAYLTQSGQLYNEATAAAFGKVYCFGPAFRAERSKTRRHLTEFWMVEPEVAFADLDHLMVLTEEFLSFIVKRVLENR